MKVSVIIPYYNPDGDRETWKLLIRAIRSARDSLSQDCDCEIVVVNDGSGSNPDLSSVKGLPVRYIDIPHRMLGGARNAGMDNASGDIITFLDADDIYYPGALTPCIKAMQELDADLIGFGMIRVKDSGNCLKAPKGKPAFSRPVTGSAYMRDHDLYGSACRYLIRTSFIRSHGLRFMENAYIEDEEFTPRMMYLAQRYSETQYPVYAYCIRKGSIIMESSHSRIETRQADTLKALSHLVAFRGEHMSQPHEGLDRKINTLAMDHLRRTLRRDDWRDVISAQKDALRDMGLYPLQGNRSFGFTLYRLLSRNMTGLTFLRLIERFYI